jgi:hypothetical protein
MLSLVKFSFGGGDGRGGSEALRGDSCLYISLEAVILS